MAETAFEIRDYNLCLTKRKPGETVVVRHGEEWVHVRVDELAARCVRLEARTSQDGLWSHPVRLGQRAEMILVPFYVAATVVSLSPVSVRLALRVPPGAVLAFPKAEPV